MTPAAKRTEVTRRTGGRGPDEPALALENIQGNIVPGFSKDHQWFAYYRLGDAAEGRQSVARVAQYVSSAAEVLAFNRLYKALRGRRGLEPAGLSATWINLAFSFPGLQALVGSAQLDKFRDSAFRAGLPLRSALLGDPPNTDQWVIGGPGNVPDLVVMVGADREDDAGNAAAAIDGALSGWQRMYLDRGRVRPDLPGHEHFGFKDGISQPGVRGMASAREGDYLTPRILAADDPQAELFAAPGQPLVWPGQFLFGYPTQDTVDPLAAGPIAAQVPDWGQDGSYVVVRRLRQDVAAFQAFLGAAAQETGLGAGLVGAKVVGRWQSGAPVLRADLQDNAALGSDRVAANDFAFATAGTTHRYRAGVHVGMFPPSVADPTGAVCPHAGHIRKVNARDEGTDLGGVAKSLFMRIIRRGVPYGPPYQPGDPTSASVDRGLIFVSYQTSIDEQFEQITTDWVNSDTLPRGGGYDPVIGQNGSGDRARTFDISPNTTIPIATEFVRATGGGYFFAPGLEALTTTLAGK